MLDLVIDAGGQIACFARRAGLRRNLNQRAKVPDAIEGRG